mmetsp:Transcript_112746/g.168719  ORF Transcript_112746/g.168719 Transcript_112746/m.168719 type:complete len:97 (-) Transcript_112746:25-315(-)
MPIRALKLPKSMPMAMVPLLPPAELLTVEAWRDKEEREELRGSDEDMMNCGCFVVLCCVVVICMQNNVGIVVNTSKYRLLRFTLLLCRPRYDFIVV